jgi:hypothetical protein
MFTDPDGLLPLSTKQRNKFKTWRRGSALCFLDPADASKRAIPLAAQINGYEVK